ncbi:MAG: IS30 family transposase [Ktedonobacteraceae bacterium]
MNRKQFVGLQDAERSEISILKAKGYSLRAIAKALGRSPNTISYEIQANSVNGLYDPRKAKAKSRVSRRSRRYQWQKIEHYPQLRDFITTKLAEHWSPDAIAGYLKHRQSVLPTVSTPQVYAWLYSSRGQAHCEHLLSHRYRPRRRREQQAAQTMIPDRVSITERPAIVATRERPGDWEGDTVVSGKRTRSRAVLAVLQERSTRLLRARLLPNARPATFSTATVAMLRGKQVHTLTLDNGIENKQHQRIAAATGAKVYFCDPYSSWQKGSIEHANKLLRRYLPKGCDLGQFDQSFVDAVCDRLNKKHRKILGYKSALQCTYEKGLLEKVSY